MIPSVDSSNYSQLIEPQTTDLSPTIASPTNQNTVSASTTALGNALTTEVRAPAQFSIKTLQKLLDSVTRMMQAIALILQQRNQSQGAGGQIPGPCTVTPQTSSPTSPSQDWLKSVNEEPQTVIPDLGGTDTQNTSTPSTTTTTTADAAASTPTDSANTALSTGTATSSNPPGAATLPIDSPEVLPDLSDVQAPSATTKQYNIGTRLRGSGQFLWKPVSDKDGKLAVLIPSKLTGKIKNVVILSPDRTKVLAKGIYSGVGNGDREHFRFSKAGNQYPNNSIVMITLKDGSTQNVMIRNSSSRYTQ